MAFGYAGCTCTGYDIAYQLYSYCNQGASDSYSSDERSTIIQTLDKLKNSYYVQGDVDYAGRYVFTGFATDRPLTYPSDVKAAEADYTITQSFDRESISEKRYIPMHIQTKISLI